MTLIHIRVNGNPVPKQSFQYSRKGNYAKPEIKAWQSVIAAEALQTMYKNSLLVGELEVNLTFYLPDRHRRDIDNLSKGVLDALQMIVFADDQQVTRLIVEKIFKSKDTCDCLYRPGVDIMILERDNNNEPESQAS